MKKPMLKVSDLIAYMKTKGIKFNICNEQDAEKHLIGHNNYFKLTSYRKNYNKITSGTNKGSYENLDFAYLIELARIDTVVRDILLQMSLDIEHFIKVDLINAVENEMVKNGTEDGYKIIEGYLNADDVVAIAEKSKVMSKRNNQFYNKMSQNNKNPYCSGLVSSFSDDMPIWAYVELANFGDIKDLIKYYSNKTGWSIGIDLDTLDRVRQLRNACAHGNCIINDLKPVQSTKSGVSIAPPYITNYIYSAGIKKATLHTKMSNPRINQIVHLLFAYDKLVNSDNTRSMRLKDLQNLMNNRLLANKSYFANINTLISTYRFFSKICTIIK